MSKQVQFDRSAEYSLTQTRMEQRRVRRKLEDILDVKRRTLSDDWQKARTPSPVHGGSRPESPEYRSHTPECALGRSHTPECQLGRSPTPGESHVHVRTTTVYNKGFGTYGRPRTPGGRPMSPEAGKQFHHHWEVG